MNCELVRNRVLAFESPADVSAELSGHIDGCVNCRTWFRNVRLVEKALAGIPVPESDGAAKRNFLATFRAGGTKDQAGSASKLMPSSVVEAPKSSRTGSGNHKPVAATTAAKTPSEVRKPAPLRLEDDLPPKRRAAFGHLAAKFWPAGLMAATVLVGTIAWLSLRDGGSKPANSAPTDPMLDNMVALNVELAKSKSLEDRATVLAKMADEVNKEMREIARADSSGDNMKALEDMYRKVVLNGLVSQARLADKTDRRHQEIFGRIAESLAQAGQKAEQMAAESPQHSADHLREAANTAREGTKRIRNFIKEVS